MKQQDKYFLFKKIKCLINEKNYQFATIVGHSYDDDLNTFNAFKNAGADYFETKPLVLKNFQIIIEYLFKQKWMNKNKYLLYAICVLLCSKY